MTKEEWISEGKALRFDAGVKIVPDEVFDRDEIEQVDFVKDLSKKLFNQNKAFERKNSEFNKIDELKTEYETKLTEKEKELKTARNDLVKVTAKDKFGEFVNQRKLNEKQIKFIESNWDEFKVEDPEKVDESLNKFIDTGLTRFKKNAEIFGVPVDGDNQDEVDGTPAKEGKQSEGGNKDFTNPENNPLIPKD